MFDSLSVLQACRMFPGQFADAVQAPSPLGDSRPDGISSVLIAGMGGSGVVGDVARAVVSPGSPVPIVSIKSDECPGFVDGNTLVVISSFSGETSESLSVMTAALDRGASVVTVSSGGRITDLARSTGSPSWIVDNGIPCPRAALGGLTVPVLRTLDHYGLFNASDGRSLDEHLAATVEQLESRLEDLDREDGPAARLARRIGRTIPLIYGVEGLGEAAAIRWKTQFNENPKIPAFIGVIPEITHNEICGWAQHGDMTRQVFTLVMLRHSFESQRSASAMDLVAEITDEVVSDVHEVAAKGSGPLAQFFDLAMIGDFVSLQMALTEGIDPGPVPMLDEVKARLDT